MIIAIDGPAASGKGTLGKRLAAHYGFRHLDTGLLYRAVAKALLDAGHDARRSRRGGGRGAWRSIREQFDEPELKTQRSARRPRSSSAIPEVRAALVGFQRDFAAEPPGAVLDGRDIGTVICPQCRREDFRHRRRRRCAPAGGRWKLAARGEAADEAAVLADILKRDERDQNRAAAPLKQAADAHLLDTTHLDIERRIPGRRRHRRGRPSGPEGAA